MANTEGLLTVAFDAFFPNTLNVGPSVAFLVTMIPLHCYVLSGVHSAVIQFVGGFLVWSVCWGALEYAMHKRDHGDRGSRHMAHHGNPSDRTLQDVDLEKQKERVLGYILVVWIYSGFWVAIGNFLGLVSYYINYERLHQLVHDRPIDIDPWTSVVLDWHSKHHDAWGVNFSVTTPLWDVIEGTVAKKMKPAFDKRVAEVGWFSVFFPLIAPVSRVARDTPKATEKTV